MKAIKIISFIWCVIFLGFGFQIAFLITTKLPFYLTPLIPILFAKMWFENLEKLQERK
jgi:hypothetical protein